MFHSDKEKILLKVRTLAGNALALTLFPFFAYLNDHFTSPQLLLSGCKIEIRVRRYRATKLREQQLLAQLLYNAPANLVAPR